MKISDTFMTSNNRTIDEWQKRLRAACIQIAIQHFEHLLKLSVPQNMLEIGKLCKRFNFLPRAAGGVIGPACWAPASLIRPTPKKTPVA